MQLDGTESHEGVVGREDADQLQREHQHLPRVFSFSVGGAGRRDGTPKKKGGAGQKKRKRKKGNAMDLHKLENET